jgi:DNA polymerase-1
MGVNALKQNLGSTREEAQKFYDKYFETFSDLAKFLDETKASASRLGYTTTMYGRRRYFEGITSHLPFIRASAERMAINAPIQGTQADIVKIAMSRINTFLEKEKLSDKVFLILQIHDELIYEMKKDVAKDVSEKIKKIMQEVMDGVDTKGIPVIANASLGKNWGNMEVFS